MNSNFNYSFPLICILLLTLYGCSNDEEKLNETIKKISDERTLLQKEVEKLNRKIEKLTNETESKQQVENKLEKLRKRLYHTASQLSANEKELAEQERLSTALKKQIEIDKASYKKRIEEKSEKLRKRLYRTASQLSTTEMELSEQQQLAADLKQQIETKEAFYKQQTEEKSEKLRKRLYRTISQLRAAEKELSNLQKQNKCDETKQQSMNPSADVGFSGKNALTANMGLKRKNREQRHTILKLRTDLATSYNNMNTLKQHFGQQQGRLNSIINNLQHRNSYHANQNRDLSNKLISCHAYNVNS